MASPEAIANPYPLYKSLREEKPVYQSPEGYFVLTRYDDVVNALRSERLTADRRAVFAAQLKDVNPIIMRDFIEFAGHNMLLKDAPDHTKIRKVANHGFTRHALKSWRVIVQKVTDDLLDQAEAKGSFDFVEDFADPFSVRVIAQMFGVSDEEHGDFHQWSMDIVKFFGGTFDDDVETIARNANNAVVNLREFFKAKILERQDNPGQDLISYLSMGYQHGKYDLDVLWALCILIIVAGHTTTIDELGNSMNLLFDHPEQLQALKDDPELIHTAIEEMLRYHTAVPFTFRLATQPVTFGNVEVPAGGMVMIGLGAANHDPEKFEDPETFDITREDNKHLSFGFGAHFCLGAILARVQLETAFTSLLKRMPNIKRDETKEAELRAENIMFRGFKKLPVTF